jgi:ATP phosphoribosyltransferase regulatory subunit
MIEIKLNDLYESYGYRKFKISKFEPYDLYADNRDFLKSSQLITFTDLDGSLLALKPDVTLSIVKSNGGGEEKVYYNETVYRPKENHYREILQAGVERIGKIDVFSEAEIIALAAKSIQLISDRFVIRLSDAAFLGELFQVFGISPSTREELLLMFSMKNTSGVDEMVKDGRLTQASADSIRHLIDLYLPFEEGVEEIRKYAFSNTSMEMVQHLSDLSKVLKAYGVLDSIYLDFSLVNSMDYYNGILFQGAVAEIPFTILTGGRYDRLPEKMGKKEGAIGFALDLDLVGNYLSKPKTYDVDDLIVYPEDTDPAALARTVEGLIEKGHKVRTVREDEMQTMEQKVHARSVLSPEEAEELLKKGEDLKSESEGTPESDGDLKAEEAVKTEEGAKADD